jgi:U3 small nucleolar RNA-associated protein 7
MITLDPEFVGAIAPPTKLTTTVDGDIDIPFARLPRQERLKLQGRADQTEEVSDVDERDDDETKAHKREEKEKKKMRGKGKALKRYLRKQRKNVIDPRAVSVFCSKFNHTWLIPSRLLFERNTRRKRSKGKR